MKLNNRSHVYILLLFLCFLLTANIGYTNVQKTQPTTKVTSNQENVPAQVNKGDYPLKITEDNYSADLETKTPNKKTVWFSSIKLTHIIEHLIANLIIFLLLIFLAIFGWRKYMTPENIANFFEGKRSQTVNTEYAETHKSILKKFMIVKQINFKHEALTADELFDEFLSTKSIIKEWDHHLEKPFKFDWEGFFSTNENALVKQKIAQEIIKRYKEMNISGIILLPFDRNSNAQPIPHIAKLAENGLKGKQNIIKITLTQNFMVKERLENFDEADNILIIQPAANIDAFVSEIATFTQKETKAKIAGIVTIFDSVGDRPLAKGEDVLIKLNLDGNKQD